jgi:hypothetical protein
MCKGITTYEFIKRRRKRTEKNRKIGIEAEGFKKKEEKEEDNLDGEELRTERTHKGSKSEIVNKAGLIDIKISPSLEIEHYSYFLE